MRWSIRYRLLVPLGLVLLGVVGISVWTALAAARNAEERIARSVRSTTQTLTGLGVSPNQAILEQMKGLSGAEYLFVDSDGNRLSTFRDRNLPLPRELETQSLDIDALGVPVSVEGRSYRCRKLPQRAGGNYYIFYPEESLNEAIRDAVWPSLVFGLGGGLSAILLMFVIGQRLVGRIRDLERRTRQIARGDFSPMPLPRQDDELRDLSRSVNEMVERLDQLQRTVQQTERLRLLGQLSGGLAHQLRNGLTGARLALQLHALECDTADDESIQVALRQLALLETNLRRFIDLGRPEPRVFQPCGLVSLIDEVASLLGPQARHAGVSLIWQRPTDEIRIPGEADQLRDVFLNLVGNAIEAAGNQGTVAIDLRRENHGVAVEIADTGPGPPLHLAEKIFEPFVTGKPEGIGLGLAVARQAVESHRGALNWRREGERTIFRVTLPLEAS